MTGYIYTVVREYPDGNCGRRRKRYYTFRRLKVGGLYSHLGKGYPGMHRILAEDTEELPDSE